MRKEYSQFGDFNSKYTDKRNAKIVLQPVPYDGTSTWRKGADKGPEALLKASYNLEFYDIETRSEVYKHGIYTANPIKEKSSPEKMVDKVYHITNGWLDDNKFIVTIGGEHSISVGAIKAHSEKYTNFSVLQLDAHADLRESFMGSKFNHACVMARVKEICPFIQVGIRSMDIEEAKNIMDENIFYAEHIFNNELWFDNAINQLTKNVYITIDLDVFDPAYMPSTGTPEPGGLDWYLVVHFLKKVFEKRNVVGFDVVELCPDKNNPAPDFLAAKLIYKLLSYKFIE